MKEHNEDTRGEISDKSNYRGDDESNKVILINALLKENGAVDDAEGFKWSIDEEDEKHTVIIAERRTYNRRSPSIILIIVLSIFFGFVGGNYSSFKINKGSIETTNRVLNSLNSDTRSDISLIAPELKRTSVSILSYADTNSDNVNQGSGVFIGDGSYIITNYHVIKGYKDIYISLDGSSYKRVQIVYVDDKIDLALLKSNKEAGVPSRIREESSVQSGEDGIVIGNPLGVSHNSISKVLIASTGVKLESYPNMPEMIQISGSLNKGNSGGGLFDINGRLIGIVTFKGEGDGIGYAIPIEEVVRDIDRFDETILKDTNGS